MGLGLGRALVSALYISSKIMVFISVAVILATCRSLFDGNDIKDSKWIWKRRFKKGRPEI